MAKARSHYAKEAEMLKLSDTAKEILCSNPSLKRKRPPKIEIPSVLQEIQKDKLEFRDLTPQNDAVSYSGTGVAVSAIKGKKKFMEDSHKIVSCLQGNSNKSFFGVYDGHGGTKASDFVAENLHTNMFEMMKKCTVEWEKEEAVKAGYLKTDEEFLKQGLVSGACCVTALIEGKEIVISNLGDCRAVLSRGGVAEALTTDHKAEREDERERIQNKGGYVEFHRGAWRVHGVLSVSRSIGDSHLKNWVVAEPETKILHFDSNMEFLVLASDGLWEKVGDQEAIDTVKRFVLGKTSGSLGDSSKENDENYGRVNVSPSSKLRRFSLVKKFNETNQSPKYYNKKIADSSNQKDNEDDFSIEMASPLAKFQSKENDENYGCINVSPSSKLRRVSLIKKLNKTSQSLRCYKKTVMESPTQKDNEDDFSTEFSSPPTKSRRISLVKRINIKTEASCQENTGYKNSNSSTGLDLMAACKELANLSLSRGCLDDITVMIIDLNHFRCNN